MSDYFDEYGELELNEEEARRLDMALERPLGRGAVEFGSDAYGMAYKKDLEAVWVTKANVHPYSWQLDSALASHLGLDVLIIAGTGAGKTKAFLLRCLLERDLMVWLVSPLNALGNQQAVVCNGLGIPAMAVNLTTKYPGLYKDIKNRKYQVVISSIEAFTDTTRLLPAVKSPELAKKGKQLVVVDEAHCMARWGASFRPQYSLVGDLKLLLTKETPFIAATATANRATREAIKKSLRFGPDSYDIDLGNHCPNLAYSIHRMKNASAIHEILEYFPWRTHIPICTLVFVDSRPLGHALLHLLRQHFVPEVRHQIELYHAMRGDYDKAILAAGFEREDGYRILVCTEALALGMDYKITAMAILVKAPRNSDIMLQRGGRIGRHGDDECDVVVMVQESLFDDSKEGQKRTLKNMKKEDESPVALATRKKAANKKDTVVKSKKQERSTLHEYDESIMRFINAPGCLVEVLDKEYDNPERPDAPCRCQHHKKLRGEPSLRERMKAIKEAEEALVAAASERPGAAILASVIVNGEGSDAEDGNEGSDKGSNDGEQAKPSKTPQATKMRTKVKAQPYKVALVEWVDRKFDSEECRQWDIRKTWILPEKILEKLSRDPGFTDVAYLDKTKPLWAHRRRWGTEVLVVVQEVSSTLETARIAREEEKRQKAEEKQRKTEERERKAEEKRCTAEEKAAALTHDTLEPTVSTGEIAGASHNKIAHKLEPEETQAFERPIKRRRARLPDDATEEQKKQRKEEIAKDKRVKQRESYHLNKVPKATKPVRKTKPRATGQQSEPGPSNSAHQPAVPFPPYEPPNTVPTGLDRSVKEELIDQHDLLSDLGTNSIQQPPVRQPSQSFIPVTPTTPHTSLTASGASWTVFTPEMMANQYPTPVSGPSLNVAGPSTKPLLTQSPSTLTQRRRARPRPVTRNTTMEKDSPN